MSVSIMLALNSLMQNKFIFLDEPFQAMDEGSKFRILEILKTLASEDGKHVIIAAHNVVEGTFDSVLSF